ncbi:hypothetical protein ACFQZ2_04455 [Streptomonospora algeriensis]|uniref:RDD family protein n=1 Tax=Streptomonospora algeriensis TaxID=995084 RepID=A0ABW3BC70_9ACTN
MPALFPVPLEQRAFARSARRPGAVLRPPHSGPQRFAASFGRRLTARVIDYTVMGMVVILSFILISALAEISTGSQEISDAYFQAWVYLLAFGTGPGMFLHDRLSNTIVVRG